ncbi:MAG: ribosome biogenesis GTP-binding protein YihA/YsxC [Candidatus Cloacimonetes bacterium]|nr:ribosome biogenesis GTP-binding protein YihA/YsxC [Candidatus Cloacimonadota bacterium]
MIRIVESSFIISAVKPAGYPASPWCDIAFAGRSNVGKSSFVNALLGRKLLAKISSKPGKTRLINFFEVRFKRMMESGEEVDGFMNFVDLPGYGYAKVSKTDRAAWRRMMRAYFEQRLSLRGVIVLVDIRHPADEKDRLMIEMLRQTGHPFLVAATKRDKIAPTKVQPALDALRVGLGLADEPLLAVSSPKKQNLDKAVAWIEDRLM